MKIINFFIGFFTVALLFIVYMFMLPFWIIFECCMWLFDKVSYLIKGD